MMYLYGQIRNKKKMELTGKIISVLAPVTGQGRNGQWMKQEYVLEYNDQNSQYAKKVCFNLWGEDKIKNANIQVGQELTVSFDIDCREWNGKWFNDIRAWRVVPVRQGEPTPIAQQMPGNIQTPPQFTAESATADNLLGGNDGAGDLPF